MKMYRLTYGVITEFEILSRTAKSVNYVINGRAYRDLMITNNSTWHDTHKEAFDAYMLRYNREIERLNKQIEYKSEEIKKFKAKYENIH